MNNYGMLKLAAAMSNGLVPMCPVNPPDMGHYDSLVLDDPDELDEFDDGSRFNPRRKLNSKQLKASKKSRAGRKAKKLNRKK